MSVTAEKLSGLDNQQGSLPKGRNLQRLDRKIVAPSGAKEPRTGKSGSKYSLFCIRKLQPVAQRPSEDLRSSLNAKYGLASRLGGAAPTRSTLRNGRTFSKRTRPTRHTRKRSKSRDSVLLRSRMKALPSTMTRNSKARSRDTRTSRMPWDTSSPMKSSKTISMRSCRSVALNSSRFRCARPKRTLRRTSITGRSIRPSRAAMALR